MASFGRRAAIVFLAAILTAGALPVYAQRRGARAVPPVERLRRMSPEQRRRALNQLPPDRKKAAEDRLDRYSKLSPEERSRLNRQWDKFRKLPPERQNQLRNAFRDFQSLPPSRQNAVRAEAGRLKQMGAASRSERLNSPEVRRNFSSRERTLLREFSEY